tara:strand:- start:1568 stop:1750 length:183 start_codon:yes stop_codon:yes gene_type:complete
MRKKMSDEPIMWGWENPKYMRSEEHREFLIALYNKNKPEDQQVKTMEELNNALERERKDK